ncbi:hypothetical protein BH11PLA2_BH11PLA2_53230 [soil metagenome]
MVLSRVWYELFANEAEWIVAHPDADVELGRQLRLEMADGSQVFVSWTWGPGGDDYHVGFAPVSYCNDSPEVDRDVSAWPLWSSLIGRSVVLSYIGEGQQILAIQAGIAMAYCCSFSRGMWGMDELRVGGRVPS